MYRIFCLLILISNCLSYSKTLLPPYLHGGSFLKWSFKEFPYSAYLRNKPYFPSYQLYRCMQRNICAPTLSVIPALPVIPTLSVIDDHEIESKLADVHELPVMPASLVGPVDFMFTVKVLLEEVDHKQQVVWKLANSKGFIFKHGIESPIKGLYNVRDITISVVKGNLYVNNKRITSELFHIIPQEGLLACNEKNYPGSLTFVRQDSKWLLLNFVDIEDYIYGVLRWESWPGWPIEVNKAFAIASRSYLLKRIMESRRFNRLYHIKNTNIHQTYRGIDVNEDLLRAVNETKGIILTHNSQPIEAMFDCCCGGIIPANMEGVNFDQSPYLARTYPCTFCKPCKIYSWKASYSVDTIKKILREAGKSIKDVKHMNITHKDKAGTVHKVVIHDSSKTHSLTGRDCYKLFPHLKSFCFTIEKKGSVVDFIGKGYGHHLGICQWGARYMVDAGWNYQRILQFYYPGADFMKLKKGNLCPDIKVI